MTNWKLDILDKLLEFQEHELAHACPFIALSFYNVALIDEKLTIVFAHILW